MTRPQITVILTLLILIDLGLCWFLIRSYFSIRSTVLSPVATPDIILTAKNFPDVENLRLRFVGDIMLGRSVNLRMMKYSDYLWPFRETLHNLPAPDFFMGNLETPITDPCEPTSSGMVFCTPAKAIEGLNYAGLDMVSLANNHTLNQGKDGLFETQNHLDQAGINHIIHSQYQTVQVKNINLGIIAFDDITYPLTKDQITESLKVIPNPPDLWIA